MKYLQTTDVVWRYFVVKSCHAVSHHWISTFIEFEWSWNWDGIVGLLILSVDNKHETWSKFWQKPIKIRWTEHVTWKYFIFFLNIVLLYWWCNTWCMISRTRISPVTRQVILLCVAELWPTLPLTDGFVPSQSKTFFFFNSLSYRCSVWGQSPGWPPVNGRTDWVGKQILSATFW